MIMQSILDEIIMSDSELRNDVGSTHRSQCNCHKCRESRESGRLYDTHLSERTRTPERFSARKVRHVQRCLNQLLHLQLKVDGDFGRISKRTWKHFQFLVSGGDQSSRTGRLSNRQISELDQLLRRNQSLGLPFVFTLDKFVHDKSSIIDEHREKLCSMLSLHRVGRMIKTGRINAALFLGHADPTGSRRHNEILTKARAVEIAKHFKTAGTCINPYNIQKNQILHFVSAYGEDHQLARKPHDAQRRVEVLFLKL